MRYSKTTSTVCKVVHPASTWCIRPRHIERGLFQKFARGWRSRLPGANGREREALPVSKQACVATQVPRNVAWYQYRLRIFFPQARSTRESFRRSDEQTKETTAMLRKLLILDLIQRVGSEIRVVESGITRHENGTDSSLRDPAGIRLYHFCGIRDHNLSRFRNQGSETGYKNGNQRGKKNILRYHHVIQAWWSSDMDRTTFSEKKPQPKYFHVHAGPVEIQRLWKSLYAAVKYTCPV